MRIVLLGPPGAGKGTLAKLLKETMAVAHISTGDILREEMNQDTALGKKIKKYVESGTLVPDKIVTKITENRLSLDQYTQGGYLLDGFPRTKTQAQDLDKILGRLKKPIEVVVYMETALPVIIQRLTGRRVCRQCGALFHVVNKPSRSPEICDVCGGPLYQRPDDNQETIETRMKVYLKNTAPIIEYYAAQGKLRRINANQDSGVVKTELMKILDEEGSLKRRRGSS